MVAPIDTAIDTPPLPHYYLPNGVISLRLSDARVAQLTVQVLEPFTPFTMGQALLVKTPANPDSALQLPSHLVLKVYDPRFFSHRIKNDLLWTYTAEASAAQKRSSDTYEPEFNIYNKPDYENPDLAAWEEYYYLRAEKHYQREYAVYQALLPLQGSGIPTFFGHGTLPCPTAPYPPTSSSSRPSPMQ